MGRVVAPDHSADKPDHNAGRGRRKLLTDRRMMRTDERKNGHRRTEPHEHLVPVEF
jgi:hypothetical protein